MSALPVRPGLSQDDDRGDIIGLEAIMRLAYGGADLGGIWADLLARTEADPCDAAALMDMSIILMVSGHREAALETQGRALALRRSYRTVHGRGGGLRVLALVTAGDFMANTPVDLLLSGSDVTLHLHYVDAETPDLDGVPAHDIAFLAVAEAPPHRAILERCGLLLRDWPGPLLNGAAERIAALTRDEACTLFAGEPAVHAPLTVRAGRKILTGIATGAIPVADLIPGAEFPLIVRPVGTHAGVGLEKLDTPGAVGVYLAMHTDAQFYVAPFVNYASPDGKFRKQRIAFIKGRAYPSHLAISDDWMVHYLSAGMAADPARRAEEARWMETFDADVAVRHADAFAALSRRLGLDYFGVDCAELPDGRLLLFEADVAMIVHDLDPEDVFPYKKPAMRRLFAAFQAELARSAGHEAGGDAPLP